MPTCHSQARSQPTWMMLPVLAQRADLWTALIQDGKWRIVSIAKMQVLFVYMMKVGRDVTRASTDRELPPFCSVILKATDRFLR